MMARLPLSWIGTGLNATSKLRDETRIPNMMCDSIKAPSTTQNFDKSYGVVLNYTDCDVSRL